MDRSSSLLGVDVVTLVSVMVIMMFLQTIVFLHIETWNIHRMSYNADDVAPTDAPASLSARRRAAPDRSGSKGKTLYFFDFVFLISTTFKPIT